jgi:hypothetical protein
VGTGGAGAEAYNVNGSTFVTNGLLFTPKVILAVFGPGFDGVSCGKGGALDEVVVAGAA